MMSIRYSQALSGLLMAAAAGCGGADTSAESDKAEAEIVVRENIHGLDIVRRELDSQIGRGLFVAKACVTCHSVNGVGGKAAPALDAQIGAPPVDPLDFAARMWRGAPAMVELQSIELGYTVYLTADEIAHLAAFAADREEQKNLVIDQVPAELQDSFLDEQFWEVEDWDDFLKEGQEGAGAPEPPENSTDGR